MVNLCEVAAEFDFTRVDIALVLKLLTKFMLLFNNPTDIMILLKLTKMIEQAKAATFEEEIRAMVPYTFRGIAQVYFFKMEVLANLYKSQLSPFVHREIELGKPKPAEPLDDSHDKSNFIDLFEKEPTSRKAPRENTMDANQLVNKGIAQNLHFLICAFATFIADAPSEEEPSYMDVVWCLRDSLKQYLALLSTKDREL